MNSGIRRGAKEGCPVLWTGQSRCFDEVGGAADCSGTGQDRPGNGCPGWPEPRFEVLDDELAVDLATGLVWPRSAMLFDVPLDWRESLKTVRQMNRDSRLGRDDWRVPNRRELRSLIDHSARKPALPAGHPFRDIFLGWYWTSTTAAIAPRYAWYVHLEGGRMFYGNKDGFSWLWPVAGESDVLAATGQRGCYDEGGTTVACRGSGQDGETRHGLPWPEPRFTGEADGILDRLTSLVWAEHAGLAARNCGWVEALEAIADLRRKTGQPWRLPTINELESLVDASAHSPALAAGHPFTGVEEAYWSSTSSGFDPAWAYVLYLHKGAVGVGFKKQRLFSVWPVRHGSGNDGAGR